MSTTALPFDPSRRDAVGLLLASLSALGLAGCGGDSDPKKTGGGGDPDGADGTDAGDGGIDGPPSPELDAARLQAALGSVLDHSPWADRYQDAVAGAAAEVQALRDAGLVASADAATYLLDGVVSNVAGALGVAFADTATGEAPFDWSAETTAMVQELEANLAGVRGELAAAQPELRDALGTDTVAPSPELTAEVTAFETDLRMLMYEGGTSGQAGMNLALSAMHRARQTAGTEQSLAATVARLDTVAGAIASDAAVDDWRTSRRRPAPSYRERLRGAPPPDDALDPACEVIGWISFFVDFVKSMKNGLRDAPDNIDDVVADLPRWLQDPWDEFMGAQTIEDEVFTFAKDQLVSKVQGTATDAVLDDEVCSVIGAALVIMLWFVDLIMVMFAFGAAISRVAAPLAGTPGGGLIALVFVLMLVLILYFTLKMICAVIELKPAFDALLLGECGASR